jgi:hypothetical protein
MEGSIFEKLLRRGQTSPVRTQSVETCEPRACLWHLDSRPSHNMLLLRAGRPFVGPGRVRRLCTPPVAAHIGVLHVYRLEPASPPPPSDGEAGGGSKLRLLFPDDSASSAAQLAAAAESGELVLVPERALTQVLDSLSLGAGGTSLQQQIAAAGAEDDGQSHGADSGANGDGGGGGALTTSANGGNALALAEHAMSLSDALGMGDASNRAPDWRSTQELERAEFMPQPTDAQQAVLVAATDGDVDAIRAAIAACPREDLLSVAQPPSGATPLHLAATTGDAAAVRALLEAGLPVHATAANGSTALHWAAGGGHVDVVRALLDAGADTRARSSTWRSTVRGDASGQTAAHWAASSGHTQALEALLHRDPHALMLEDERQLGLAAVAKRDGHPWLQTVLSNLESERVVCVRVRREATLQRPLTKPSSGGAETS